jgi:hypothetical protein
MLTDVSNPQIVYDRARKLYGDNVIIKESTRKDKKYMIYNSNTNKYIHFGSLNHLDYTKYIELYGLEVANDRREKYLKRAINIKGNWRNDIYSPNNLSIYLIWMYDI